MLFAVDTYSSVENYCFIFTHYLRQLKLIYHITQLTFETKSFSVLVDKIVKISVQFCLMAVVTF